MMNEIKEDVDNQNDDQSSAASNIHLNLKENLFGDILKMSATDQNGNSDKKEEEINNGKYKFEKVSTSIWNNENKESIEKRRVSSRIWNNENKESIEKRRESKTLNLLNSQNTSKYFIKILDNIKKEKGLNIFNSFEYVINALINMHFNRKAQTSKVDQFREKFNLEKQPANEEVFISFMESFPEFNFFE